MNVDITIGITSSDLKTIITTLTTNIITDSTNNNQALTNAIKDTTELFNLSPKLSNPIINYFSDKEGKIDISNQKQQAGALYVRITANNNDLNYYGSTNLIKITLLNFTINQFFNFKQINRLENVILNGYYLYVGASDGQVYKINTITKTKTLLIWLPDAISAFTFKDNDLYIATILGNIYKVNPITKGWEIIFKGPDWNIYVIVFKDHDLYMWVSDSSIYKINIKTNKISKIIQFQPTPRYADFNTKAPFAFAFKNNDLYVATRDSNIYRVNTITKTKTLLIKLKTRPGVMQY